jgi:hypothetical protein
MSIQIEAILSALEDKATDAQKRDSLYKALAVATDHRSPDNEAIFALEAQRNRFMKCILQDAQNDEVYDRCSHIFQE